MAFKISNELKNLIRDFVYPVGIICLFSNTTNPNTAYGGSWVKITSNRAIMSAPSDSQLNATVDSGLPNITGWWDPQWSDSSGGGIMFYSRNENGNSLYTSRPGDRGYWWAGVTVSGNPGAKTHYHTRLHIDASKSNSIYGKSSIVQPPAYYCNVWRRTV